MIGSGWLILNYSLFARDIAHELAARGGRVQLLDTRALNLTQLNRAVVDWRPEIVFGVNFAPPVAAALGALGVPYVSWTVDPLPNSRYQIMDWTRPELCLAFGHRRSICERLRGLGLESAYLPLAAPAARRTPILDAAQLDPYRCPISFVGMSLGSERRQLERELGPRLGDAGLARVQSWVEEIAYATRDDPGFDGMSSLALPEWVLQIVGEAGLAHFRQLVDGELARLYRLQCVRELESEGICVWGDADWSPQVAAYRGIADHGNELTCIYNASLVNLDVPRIYQRDIVTMRVFDVLASGGFLVTEGNPELATVLDPDGDVGVFGRISALRERVAEFLAQPDRCRDIAESGRRRVLQEHLLEHRVDTMLSRCVELGFCSATSPGFGGPRQQTA